MSMIINDDFIGGIGCIDEFYSPYIPTTSERVTISIRDVAILDSRKMNMQPQPVGQRHDPMSMVEGRWFGEKQVYLRDLIRTKTIHHEKYNSILIVDHVIEGLVNGLSDFEIRLDDWIDHDIDPFVEYFGYIRDLKIHCFRINLNRGNELIVRRAMAIPTPPTPPKIRKVPC